MEQFINWISQPWPWYVAGPLIGLTVPVLLIIGNKSFGISSSLRHVCAACMPANIPFFTYNWRKEMWNLMFVLGVLIGGFIAGTFLSNPEVIVIAESTQQDLAQLGITDFSSLLPSDIFSWSNLFTLKGLFFFVIGGFLVGFGTRYAGGCTSGHAIMGISSLQWPSLVATIFFMLGGFAMTHLLLPHILAFVGL
ncbi:YeeE/YedE family protein [Lunatimonas salinarum]|uniref:YeeE/YedE family protein n=1 Tax=Lunatimonas salinarum TaxID=1774590 RepID=UPI001ADEEE1E|nr:YeeE/YedE thiosulfate transporter family protein [Lunatimonas salinarum]